ncbi:hypothetical protein CaCOL14_002613 [Colletotrichum acutatum]|uniref:Uncharacterized protein n=1 Tax=Glomerella acutata TaxID=27357 RepID=A0AAD9CZG3_GLOAC|nr:uncharacterized protein BDZ83DRAFT_50911 [Colletotrichum acutatum]KAK1729337.1 hypothetical protein BDZ83DRAFT_50911 [Colletotrichum acutatum]
MISSLSEMEDLRSPLDRLPLVIQHPSFFENPTQHLSSSRSSSAAGHHTCIDGTQLSQPDYRPKYVVNDRRARNGVDADDAVERKDSVMTDIADADESLETKTTSLSVSPHSLWSVYSSESGGGEERTEVMMTVRKLVREFDEEGESSTAPSEEEKKKAEEMEMEKRKKEREVWQKEMDKPQKKMNKKRKKRESATLLSGSPWGGDARWVNGGRGGRNNEGYEAPGIFLQPEAPRPLPPTPTGPVSVFPPEPKKRKEEKKAKKEKKEAEKDELLVLPKVPWCHQSGGCRQKRGRRRRKMAGFAARSVDLLRRLFGGESREKKDKKGKGRARCRICGDELGFAVERAKWQEDRDAAAAAAGDKESSSGACGRTLEADTDRKDMDRAEADITAVAECESRSTLAAVRLTKIPEAWWTTM